MIRLTVAYPNTDGATFDRAYYKDKHFPLVRRLLGDAVKGAEISVPLATPGADAPAWIGIGHLLFESIEAFEAAFAANAEAILADIPNFTNVAPTAVVSESISA